MRTISGFFVATCCKKPIKTDLTGMDGCLKNGSSKKIGGIPQMHIQMHGEDKYTYLDLDA